MATPPQCCRVKNGTGPVQMATPPQWVWSYVDAATKAVYGDRQFGLVAMLHSNINERRGVSYTVYADFGLVAGSLTKRDIEIQKNAEKRNAVAVYGTSIWQYLGTGNAIQCYTIQK